MAIGVCAAEESSPLAPTGGTLGCSVSSERKPDKCEQRGMFGGSQGAVTRPLVAIGGEATATWDAE